MYSVLVALVDGVDRMCGVDGMDKVDGMDRVDKVDGVDRVARQWAGRGGCWGGLLETAF